MGKVLDGGVASSKPTITQKHPHCNYDGAGQTTWGMIVGQEVGSSIQESGGVGGGEAHAKQT